MIQKGVHLNRRRRCRKNTKHRQNGGIEVPERLEFIMARFQQDESEDEQENVRTLVGALDSIQRMIKFISKEETKVKAKVADFKD